MGTYIATVIGLIAAIVDVCISNGRLGGEHGKLSSEHSVLAEQMKRQKQRD